MSKIVYVGPTIPGVANKNTFYDDAPSEALLAACEEAPFMASLIVPMSGLAEALVQLRYENGAMYALYKKALDYYGARE